MDSNEKPRKHRPRSLVRTVGLASFVVLVVASSLALVFAYLNAKKEVLDNSRELSNAAAASVSAYFSGLDLNEVFSSGDAEVYEGIRDDMNKLCFVLNLKYLYVYRVNDARDTRTYMFVVGTGDNDDMIKEVFPFGAESSESFTQPEFDALDGKMPTTYDQLSNEYGFTYTWYYPLKNEDGTVFGLIGVDYDAGTMLRSIADNTLSFALPMVGIQCIIIPVGLWALNRRVLSPLRTASESMKQFTKKGTHKHIDIARDDEIGEIIESYNKMSDDIERYIGELEEMTVERVANDTELAVARRIQEGIVPATKELVGEGFEVYAFARSARSVGGDFYDVFELPHGRLGVVMADVSGKGVSAALFMAMCKTFIREKSRACRSAAEVLNEANDAIVEENPEGLFVTAFLGIFDPSTGVLQFANAGHTRPLLVGTGFLDPDPGIALGVFEDAGIVDDTLHVPAGAGVVLYTDGVTEAVSGDKTFFGEERLQEAAGHAATAREAVERTVAVVDAFVGEREQFDDLTMLALFATPVRQTAWSATLEPELESFGRLKEVLLDMCGTGLTGKRAVLACDEVFANIVMYAGATSVDVTCAQAEDGLRVTFADDGVAFDPLAEDASDKDFDDFEDFDEGGMGLSLVKQVARHCSYERTDDRNVLTLVLNR